jgi:hypothetical protein
MTLKISFGMIVLNGEPFLRYNLRSLYPFAHQIIVVEGACPGAAAVATSDGHSTDGTLELLNEFKRLEDPDNKLIIVHAVDDGYVDGFWPEKDEMSRGYASRATGDYLWQVDSDEFYQEEQMLRLLSILETERPDAVSFPTITFWGGLHYIADSFYMIRDNAREYHRLFAWGPGYSYKTHRPPTVVDANGVDTRRKKWLRAADLRRLGIFHYHYSLLFPLQVFNKVSYYQGRDKDKIKIDSWEESVYRRLEKPFRAHNVYQHIGWLERFSGQHPAFVVKMMEDIEAGKLAVQLRGTTDVEVLLGRWSYRLSTTVLRCCAHIMSLPPFYFLYRIYRRMCSLLKNTRS